MPDYRLYTLAEGNRITAPPTVIDCKNDHDAIAQARQSISGNDIEVWVGARCVMRIRGLERTWTERHDEACRHAANGRQVIDRQRDLIKRQKAFGADTTKSEALLATFEQSQAIFESDVARIRQERE